MAELALAALVFLGTHLGIAGTPLRTVLVDRIGENTYLIAYSLLTLAVLVWLADSYSDAPYVETWGQLYVLQPLALVLMFLAVLLVVLGITTPSPTVVGGEEQLAKGIATRGVLRITRHPFLMGVALWAITHLLVNGDLAGLILFGSMLLLAILGALSIDAKRAAKMGDQWREFAAGTSILPFAAILQRRNRLAINELGWWRPLAAVVVYLVLLYFHSGWFGVSPLSAVV